MHNIKKRLDMEIKQDRLTLVDIERRLIDDTTGEYRRLMIDKLEQYLCDLKIKLSNGLSPEEFNVSEKMKAAIEAAKKILQNFK